MTGDMSLHTHTTALSNPPAAVACATASGGAAPTHDAAVTRTTYAYAILVTAQCLRLHTGFLTQCFTQ